VETIIPMASAFAVVHRVVGLAGVRALIPMTAVIAVVNGMIGLARV